MLGWLCGYESPVATCPFLWPQPCIPAPLWLRKGLERSLVLITCHWQAPLQAPSSSAGRRDKDGVAVGLLGDPERGVKSHFSGSPQLAMEGDLRATSLISPSLPAPPRQQVTSPRERPSFRQLQQHGTTFIFTDWEGGVKKKHHTMKRTVFLQEYKW